jgi:arsenate reductase
VRHTAKCSKLARCLKDSRSPGEGDLSLANRAKERMMGKGKATNSKGGRTTGRAGTQGTMRLIQADGVIAERPRRPRGPVTIFHNPRCSTSRKALARLVEAGIDPIIVDYLRDPPSALALADIARKAGLHPREMIRTKEAEFQALGRKLEDLSAAAAIAAMTEHPALIERPIVVRGARALIARPPERVDEIMGPPAPVIPIAKLRPRKGTKITRRTPA